MDRWMEEGRDAVNEGTGHGNKLRISRGWGVGELFPGYQHRPWSVLHHCFSTPVIFKSQVSQRSQVDWFMAGNPDDGYFSKLSLRNQKNPKILFASPDTGWFS